MVQVRAKATTGRPEQAAHLEGPNGGGRPVSEVLGLGGGEIGRLHREPRSSSRGRRGRQRCARQPVHTPVTATTAGSSPSNDSCNARCPVAGVDRCRTDSCVSRTSCSRPCRAGTGRRLAWTSKSGTSAKAEITKTLTPRFMRRTFQDLGRAANVHANTGMQEHYSSVGDDEKRSGLAEVIALAGALGEAATRPSPRRFAVGARGRRRGGGARRRRGGRGGDPSGILTTAKWSWRWSCLATFHQRSRPRKRKGQVSSKKPAFLGAGEGT